MGLLPDILNGISLGLLFALIALGFMLIVGVMEVINLAHGSLFALGAYIALWVMTPRAAFMQPAIDSYNTLPVTARYALALILAPALVGALGMGLELCMRRTYGKQPIYGLLLTFGAALVIEEAIRSLWGPAEQSLTVPAAIKGGILFQGITYSYYRMFASVFSMVMIGLLWIFIEKTPYGSMIKAGAHDSEMVRALGIDIKRLRMWVFGLGAALAALAGIILSELWGIRPHMGVDAVIPAFLVIVIGGVGSFWGAVMASLMVGLIMELTPRIKDLAGFIGGSEIASKFDGVEAWKALSMYLLVIAVVTFRSRGFFGKKSVLDA